MIIRAYSWIDLILFVTIAISLKLSTTEWQYWTILAISFSAMILLIINDFYYGEYTTNRN